MSHSLSTSVHDGLLHAFSILHALGARVRQTSLLLYGQRVDVSAQQERLTVSILQHGCETMAANVRMDLKGVERFEMLDDGRCGLFFAKGKLGMRMEPLVCSC